MRKLPIILLALLILTSLPMLAMGAITGTKHDFSTTGDSTGEGYGITGTGVNGNQICVVCHTPHNGSTAVAAPLWDHTTTTATFQPYEDTGTLDATVGDPQGVSLLCLSCHDGTVALDAFDTNENTPSITITGSGLVGTDLRNDHPVSFTYNAALVTTDGELNDPTAAPIVDWLFGAGNDQLECGSCHDVHDDTNSPFLRVSNENSDLCLTCHNK